MKNKLYISKLKEFGERFLTVEKEDGQRFVVLVTRAQLNKLVRQYDNPIIEK